MGSKLVVFVGAVALFASSLTAQEQTGALEGTVTDSSGGVVAGAAVEARSPSGLALETSTDAVGVYRFPAVPPGRWAVSAALAGFRTARVEGVRLALGQLLRVDLMLEVGTVSEEVDVRAESSAIDVRTSARSTTIRDEYANKLPRGRDFTSLVTQAPGANWEKKARGLTIDGATEGENRYMVDGLETSALDIGWAGLEVRTDFVEEVQVKSSGFAAEYGGATGGVVNILTRSGTNQWHGSAWTYFQADELGYSLAERWHRSVTPAYADGRPSLRFVPDDPTQTEHVTYPKDDVAHWEPGFSLGGPLARDRAWFYVGYNPSFRTQDREVTRRSDESLVRHRSRRTANDATANVSAQLGRRTRARVAFNSRKWVWDDQLPNLAGLDDPWTTYDWRYVEPNWALSGNVDVVASPRLYLNLRAGYFVQDQYNEKIPHEPLYWFSTSNLGMAGVPEDLQRTRGYSTKNNYETRQNRATRLSLQADATWVLDAAGPHTLKAGVQYSRLGHDIDTGSNANVVHLFWDQSFGGARGMYGFYRVFSNELDPRRGFITLGSVRTDNWALFVQDSWALARRLTLNLGLRAERERIPSYARDPDIPETAIEFPFADKLAPRLGFAWDVTGDGRLKLFGSWGLFYDIMKLNMAVGAFGARHQQVYFFGLDTPEWPTLADDPTCPPDCPGELLLGPIFAGGRPVNDPEIDGIDPGLEPHRLQEATLGIEHALTPTLSVAARYVHKQLDRAVEDIGAQDADRNEVVTIGNPGFGRAAIAHVFEDGTTVPYPRAVRDYDALELLLDRRLSDGWALRASYLWSRLRGNYSGLANGDENGRLSPNTNRVFDHPVMQFDERGEAVIGPLPTDRPHQFKTQLIFDLSFGTTVGLNGYLASGTPVTRMAYVLGPLTYPVPYLGRESDGRTSTRSQLDLLVRHEIRLGGQKRLQLELNVLNLFDQRTATNRYPFQNQSGLGVSTTLEEFFGGVDTEALMQEQGLPEDPRFLMDSEFQIPREIRLGIRFVF